MEQDVHNYRKRLEGCLRILHERKDISLQNKKDIVEFKDECFAQGLSFGRVARYMFDLKTLATWLGKDFRKATEADLKKLVVNLEQMHYKPSTKRDFKVTLRKFFRFLNKSNDVPPKLRWLKIENKINNRKLPEELLTEDEVRRLINAADNSRDKALVAALYESGCRIGEILFLKIKHVTFDDYGGFLMVNGKTGSRRVRIISSIPYLTSWLNEHPQKEDQEAPLWVKRRSNELIAMTYGATSNVLLKLRSKAKVSKPVNPHNFRHSRATYLANHLTEAQMKEYLGWVQASEMASIYVHLSGRDIDNAILKTYGLQAENNGKQESILKPAVCQRCSESNPSTNKYCQRCGFPLNEKERLKLIESNLKRAEVDKVMDELIKDDEFRIILQDKIKSLMKR